VAGCFKLLINWEAGSMKKKPYEKPDIIYRQKIEARAGSCNKVGSSQPSCGAGPYVS